MTLVSGPTIAIVDYQAGNLRSVQKALERFGVWARITSDPGTIDEADGLVFPGQGSCDSAMKELRARGLEGPIKDFIESGRPFLGVCLGLQLMLEDSEEGSEPGLGILKGSTRRLPAGWKVPHMGWNSVELKSDHPVLSGTPTGSYFYFVHSYYADPDDRSVVVGTTDYGLEFCSAVAWDNVLGVQFHPEKSGEVGLRIYESFADFVRSSGKA